MKKNGFVTSALLYGILSLFLLLILGTISIIGSRKLTNDKIKQSALDDVQDLKTDLSCFTIDIDNKTITGYNFEKCTKTVFIPNDSKVTKIGERAFAKDSESHELKNVTIYSNIEEIADDAFKDQEKITFILKNPKGGIINKIKTNQFGAINSTYRID